VLPPPPFRPPLARSFPPRLALHVLDSPHVADEKPQELAQRRLVECTAHAVGCGLERYRVRHFETDEAADAPHVGVEIAVGDLANASQHDRTREKGREDESQLPRHAGDCQIGLPSEILSRSAKHCFGIGTAADETCEADSLLLVGTLVSLRRVGVSPDLGIDGLAQAESLVAELVDQLGFQIIRGIDVANRVKQTQWQERVDRRHVRRG
jgi:hypothetical protein